MIRFEVVGSNGTYPTAGRPASGYLVTVQETTILLDCGPGVFPRLSDAGVIPDVIVLTHVHGDHCLDVLPLFNHLRFDRPDRRGIRLLAPTGVVDRLAAFAGAGPNHQFFEVFRSEVVSPGDTLTAGKAQLSFGEASHPVPAVCVRVEDAGSSLTYSGDTGPGGDLVELADGADVLLCEATHQGEPPSDRYGFHLYASEAGEVAARAGAGSLLVTHLAPTLDPARSVAEASTAFPGPVEHAVPGLRIDIG